MDEWMGNIPEDVHLVNGNPEGLLGFKEIRNATLHAPIHSF